MSQATTAAAFAIGRALTNRKWRGRSEADIADEIERVLNSAIFTGPCLPMTFHREYALTKTDRFDFAAVIECQSPNIVVIEVKINEATLSKTAEQMQRYAVHDQVGAIILATTSQRLTMQCPRSLQEKPIYPLHLPRI